MRQGSHRKQLNMNTAIIGSKGFLGSHFVQAMPDAFPFCRENASDFSCISFSDWPWTKQYDLIIHCASTSDLVQQSQIDANIIKWWRDYQNNDSILVTFGTDASYSEKNSHIEIYYLDDYPNSRWQSYAYVKRSLYNLLQTVKKTSFHFPITSLFGPGFKLDDEHLIHSLIKKIMIMPTDKIVITGSDDIKECVYVPDLVKNVLNIVDTYRRLKVHSTIAFNSDNTFNLGSPKKQSPIQDIVQKICSLMGYSEPNYIKGSIKYRKWLDSTMAINWLKSARIDYFDTDWDKALQKTIDYYMKEIKEI